jgi:hypothetical protein
MSILMSNSLEADGPIKPPLKTDGSFYRYCMYFENNKSIIFSDDMEKIIARIIPGYDRLGAEQQDSARLSYYYDNFIILQTNYLQNASYEESELTEILKPKEVLPQEITHSKQNLLVISNEDIEGVTSLKYDTEYNFLESLDKVGNISFFTA